ncbi:MAG: helix-turn-helix domain-containing protein [Desulfococcaceae bacterium]
MSTKTSLNVNSILDRIKRAMDINTDAELAQIIGIKANSLSMWRRRNTVDVPLLITKFDELSADWVLFGRGEMKAGPGDDLTRKIIGMLEGMDEDGKRDVLRYTQKAELIEALMRERKKA